MTGESTRAWSRRARLPLLCGVALLAVGGCGTSEESGEVGETLSAKGLRVTVAKVDTSVPTPAADITGLSRPSSGSKLVGARVRVCSDHGGAIGSYSFRIETSSGAEGQLKHPQRNYPQSFEPVRDGCGGGWVVFEIPERTRPERVTFGFQDTGTSYDRSNEVDARFSWAVSGA